MTATVHDYSSLWLLPPSHLCNLLYFNIVIMLILKHRVKVCLILQQENMYFKSQLFGQINNIGKMQQLLSDVLIPKWYFAMGAPEKTSLSIQYCRESGLSYFCNPSHQQLLKCKNNAIIEGTLELFESLEKIKPQLHLIYFGTDYSNEKLKTLRRQYMSIGHCKNVPVLEYEQCRKSLNSNIIFVYGPVKQQNEAAATTLAQNLSYLYAELPKDPNDLILRANKTKNYIINGSFTKPGDINIINKYFNIRIIHFKHYREDLPKFGKFFDEEHDLLLQIKDKQFYFEIKGNEDPVLIMDNVGVKLCPSLLFLNYDPSDSKYYVNQYIEQTDGLILSIYDIQSRRKRKGLPILSELQDKVKKINEILYVDLNRKEVLFTDFPWRVRDFITIENMNRKFTYFVDLVRPHKYKYSKEYSSQIYFLETQRRISPTEDLTLKQELTNQAEYWVVGGPGTCGKTSIAKYVASEFGLKLIEYDVEAASAKEKIASPEDGDEVPAKKYIAYFANLIKHNPQIVFIFDNLPYQGADLQLWIRQSGCPNVINLKLEPTELIKRTRKKAEADVNAEVSEEDLAKANESIAKNCEWIERLAEFGPSSKIFQVDYSQPQILAESHINLVMRPRIFLVQRNNHLVYQNIAIRYNLGFINLNITPLRDCALIARKCGKRDIIICQYGQTDQRLVSQDMYWIEKNLGEIRYLGIWEPQQTEIHQKKMRLERPPVPEKPKPAEGEEEKEEEAVDGEEGKPKKIFDIYEHEWSEPVCHKNLSQWFFKLKKKVSKVQRNTKECYEGFGEVLNTLNSESNKNFYEVIK